MYVIVYNFYFSSKTKLFVLLLLMSFQINAQISFSNQNSLLQNSDFHSGVAIGIADMNGDGLDDIIRYNQGKDLHIEYQTIPNSLFQTYHFGSVSTASEWSTCIADYDKNGYNDILVSGAYDNIKMLKANINGTAYTSSLLPSSNIFIQGSNFVDIDNDGWVDVFACHDDGTSRSYRNDGTGIFTFDNTLINTQMASGNSGNYASSWIDYDNDGDLDMYLSKCRQGVSNPADLRRINRLFQNDGNNNFTDVAPAANMAFGDQTWSADFADIDNDGDLDCFMINHYTSSLLMLNNGDGTFTDITPTSGMQNDLSFFGIQAIFRDFDNDGFVDLVISGTEDRLFRNNGNNTFTNTGFNFSTNDMESFAIGDLNADGYLDIYAGYANLFSSPTTIDDILWMNNGGANNYFSVTLKGVQSNSNGVGARVELHGAWGIQIREVQSGEGYGINNTFTKHFGIGTATQIDKLVVKWPSGTVTEILNPGVNQFLRLTEGDDVGYCNITSTNTDVEWIEYVSFEDINNNSGDNNGYQDFTNLSTELDAGGSYTISLVPGFPGLPRDEFWEVWIDYNADGDFDDAGELALQVHGSAPSMGLITIPLTATLNTDTRMRITMKWLNYTGSCGSFTNGEAEDYTLHFVNNPTAQTIDFPQISDKLTTDAPFTLNATATSGLPVSFAIVSGPATISGTTLTLNGTVGNVIVRASQAGNSSFDPAPLVDQLFSVAQGDGYCSITSTNTDVEWIEYVSFEDINNNSGDNNGYQDFTNLSTELDAGGSYTISLVPGFSGLPRDEFWEVWIDYNADGDFDDTGELALQVHGSAPSMGLITIPLTATLDTDTRMRITMKWLNYTGSCGSFTNGEAEDYTLHFVNNPTAQTIDFPQISDKLTTDAPFTLNATATSGLPVSFAIVSGPATISGTTLTLNGTVGNVIVRASQAGNSSFDPAPLVDQLFHVTAPTSNCSSTSNLALNKPATQSSVVFGAVASRAVDGNTNGNFLANSVTATNNELNAWWEVDLGDVYNLEQINLWNRTDNRSDRLSNYYVFVSDTPFSSTALTATINQTGVDNYYQSGNAGTPSAVTVGRTGRYVRIQLNYAEHLTIAEVEVMGCSTGNDTTAPDVTLSTPSSNVSGSFPVTVNFTETISGLTLGDFTVTNGTATNLNGAASNYSISVTPINEGLVTVRLAADKVTDNAGNGNTISNLLSVNYTDGGGGENCSSTSNLALNKPATQSSVVFGATASRAVDGNTNGNFLANSVTATNNELNAWWEVDLGDVYKIEEVNLWNRTDNRSDRVSNFYLLVSDVPFSSNNLATVLTQAGVDNYYQSAQAGTPSAITVGRTGRYVRVQLNYAEHLTIAEVEVMGCSAGADVTPPTIALSTASNIVNGSFIVNADFSEGITGFALSDLTLTNGTATALNGSGANYNFTITPTTDGVVSIQLPQNTVSDGAGNPNTISNNLQVTYDSGLTNENYCTSVSDFPWHEWITGVKLGTIDNTSGKNPYTDFTNISTTLTVGQNYNIDLTAGFSYNSSDQYWSVWIDLNHDNDFDDAGEIIFEDIMVNTGPGATAQTLSGSLSIPTTATNGNTRMRVSMRRDAYASSCGSIDFGEIEDYTVNIAGASSATGSSTRALFYLIANKENQKVQLEWVTNTEIENNYFVIERSIDGENFEEIGNLDSKFDLNTSSITYHFEDESPENGDNFYQIRKFHHDGTELLSEFRKVSFDIDIEAVSYFPNPTLGDIWLNLKPFAGKQATMFLYNSLGQQQEVAEIPQIPNAPMLLDLSKYQNGIYYIKIKVEGNRQFTKKVILNRMY